MLITLTLQCTLLQKEKLGQTILSNLQTLVYTYISRQHTLELYDISCFQCLRYRPLIIEDSKFLKALEALKIKLIMRGHPNGLIERLSEKVKGISQKDLVYKEYHKTRNVILFIIPYSINPITYVWGGLAWTIRLLTVTLKRLNLAPPNLVTFNFYRLVTF